MFRKAEDLLLYVAQNYPEVTSCRIDDFHWNIECGDCRMTRGLHLTRRSVSCITDGCGSFCRDFDAPITCEFLCPVCNGFKQWILYEIFLPGKDGKSEAHYFRVRSVPSEGLED